MKRNLVRALTVFASAACLMGLNCVGDTLVGPAGLLPAGDYRLTRPTEDTKWVVPAPAPHQGCATLVDSRILIDENGSVVHTRTLTQVQNGQDVIIEHELRTELSAYEGSSYVTMNYGTGMYESALLQSESTTANPNATALYVDHSFRGDATCGNRDLRLRYTRQGTTG